jgi:hypothetical protein
LGVCIEHQGGWGEDAGAEGVDGEFSSIVGDLKQLEEGLDGLRDKLEDTAQELEAMVARLPMDSQRSGRALTEKYQSLIHNAMTKLNIQDFVNPHQLSSTRSSSFKDRESPASPYVDKAEIILSPFKQKSSPSYGQQLGLLNTKQIKVFDFEEMKEKKGTGQGCFILETSLPETEAFYLRKVPGR